MPLDIKPPESLTFAGILLTAINGLFVAVSAMALYILRGHKQRVDEIERAAKERDAQIEADQRARLDEIEKKHATLSAAHFEALIAQSNFITRDDMEEYLRELEMRLSSATGVLHNSNVGRFDKIDASITEARREAREDVGRIHKRIDQLISNSNQGDST